MLPAGTITVSAPCPGFMYDFLVTLTVTACFICGLAKILSGPKDQFHHFK